MATRIGINGFGRIGRQVLRATMERHPDILEVVAVNDLTDAKTNAHLFKYDSTYGRYPGTVQAAEKSISVDGREITITAERDPAKIPWGDMGVDIVIESTGVFTDASKAAEHIKAGAKKVIISAPASGEDMTIVLGVNEDQYDPAIHHVMSNASCTTNCVATMVKVIHDNFQITNGLMTTVHSYTNDQRILDQAHGDLRRARAAAENIIPTTTGAARACGIVMPELQGKVHGISLRIPTATVSVTDFVCNVERDVTVEAVNSVLKEASEGKLKGILGYNEEPLVSTDYKQDSHSCIVDGLSTMTMGNNMIKVLGWYDNEWGYSCRTADLCAFLAGKGI